MPIVNSSNIYGYGYLPESRKLIVEFRGGRTYTYYNVPQDIADGLGTAESAGQYLNAHIKGVYGFEHGGSLAHEYSEEKA